MLLFRPRSDYPHTTFPMNHNPRFIWNPLPPFSRFTGNVVCVCSDFVQPIYKITYVLENAAIPVIRPA